MIICKKFLNNKKETDDLSFFFVYENMNNRIEVLKEVLKDPELIIKIVKFILDLLAKGYTREQSINSTVAYLGIPIDKITKVVDYIIKRQRQGKKIYLV